MSAPTLDGRLLCACNCAYLIDGNGNVAADGGNIYYAGAGFTQPPAAFLGGTADLDACLVGTTADGVVLAFRGTIPFDVDDLRSLRDWLQDFNAYVITPDWLPGSGIGVHAGFLASLATLWDRARAEVRRQLDTAGAGSRLSITGHSKGGALAALTALRFWRTEQQPSHVVTSGAPRVGDRAFADVYNNSSIVHTRLEYQDDIVPHMPPSFGGFLDELQRIPWIAARLGGLERYDYEPVGVLNFINWAGQIELDSAILERNARTTSRRCSPRRSTSASLTITASAAAWDICRPSCRRECVRDGTAIR